MKNTPTQLDILAFGAHPDDVEMGAGGLLAMAKREGKQIGIVDLTQGELGTRGSAAIRNTEATRSAAILGVAHRENLKMKDGFISNTEHAVLEVIKIIRKYRPLTVLANAPNDRHPDHGKAAKLVEDAAFLSGLMKIESTCDGIKQAAWRPLTLLHYIQDIMLEPDFLVDISGGYETKMQAILSYGSQFYDPNSSEPMSYLSKPNFLDTLTGRMLDWGKIIGVKYAEGFISKKIIGVKKLDELHPNFL